MPIELLQNQNYFKFVTGRDKMELSHKKQNLVLILPINVEKRKDALCIF